MIKLRCFRFRRPAEERGLGSETTPARKENENLKRLEKKITVDKELEKPDIAEQLMLLSGHVHRIVLQHVKWPLPIPAAS
jgi:hypothetical protein